MDILAFQELMGLQQSQLITQILYTLHLLKLTLYAGLKKPYHFVYICD